MCVCVCVCVCIWTNLIFFQVCSNINWLFRCTTSTYKPFGNKVTTAVATDV